MKVLLVFFFFPMCQLMWHFRPHWKVLNNFPHLQIWDYSVPPTSNHPQYFSQSTLLSEYALPFYWWKNRKRWCGLPGINSLVCCLWKALKIAFFTWPGGSPLERHWTGLKAALQPLVLLAPGEQAHSPQLTAASWAAFSDGNGNNTKGPDFQFFLVPLTQTEFELTGFMSQGGSAATVWHAFLGTCLLFDT